MTYTNAFIKALALAESKGYTAAQITRINMTDDGDLASVELGVDADGFAIIILNFAL
jgi:hypothetical protein